MFENDRKTIGVFVCRTVEHFQHELCAGITKRARELGYNVAFFTAFGDFMNNGGFTNGEKVVIDIPKYEDFDGVILALDTVYMEDMRSKLIHFVESRCKCPVVSIRVRTDKFHNFLVNDEGAMERLLGHIVTQHHCEDIAYVSGNLDDLDARRRLAVYRNVMARHDCKVEESQIYYGTFCRKDGPLACKQIIDERGKCPEAIVCANDYMAIGVCHELQKRGIRVPEDVIVTGFDGVRETNICGPVLTTVQVPFAQMGEEAVELIFEEDEGGIVHEKDRWFQPTVLPRESCGCRMEYFEDRMKNQREFYERMEMEREETVNNTFMSVDLENVESFEQLFHVVDKYQWNIGGCSHFHLCLMDGVEHKQSGARYEHGYTNGMNLRISIRKDDQYETCNIPFKRSELLPAQVLNNDPQVYYFLSLHYKENCFGYTAVQLYDGSGLESFYHTFMVNLGNAVEDMFIRMKMKNLIEDLGDLYVRDVLTGLYNRRGFEKYVDQLFQDAKVEKASVFVIGIDLDGLKYINDTFGHAEGDVAICEVANALNDAAIHGEICGRMGGDEFSVAGICDQGNQVDEFIKRFNQYLDLINQNITEDYHIAASYGTVIRKVTDGLALEEMMKVSDNRMYKEKAKHKLAAGNKAYKVYTYSEEKLSLYEK